MTIEQQDEIIPHMTSEHEHFIIEWCSTDYVRRYVANKTFLGLIYFKRGLNHILSLKIIPTPTEIQEAFDSYLNLSHMIHIYEYKDYRNSGYMTLGYLLGMGAKPTKKQNKIIYALYNNDLKLAETIYHSDD